ncbi:MAG TPA: single-stranded DNA-binding protein [Candidatus Dormibacteraeota bacterium]
MVNKVILIGRLAGDPELRVTTSGTQVANARVATNTYAGKDESGAPREHAEFHALVMFGKNAEFAGEHLRKGRLVYAEGRTQTRSWETDEGQRRYATEVIVDVLRALGPKQEESS